MRPCVKKKLYKPDHRSSYWPKSHIVCASRFFFSCWKWLTKIPFCVVKTFGEEESHVESPDVFERQMTATGVKSLNSYTEKGHSTLNRSNFGRFDTDPFRFGSNSAYMLHHIRPPPTHTIIRQWRFRALTPTNHCRATDGNIDCLRHSGGSMQR